MMINKRQKGNIGEDIACKFLIGKGFDIVARNYQKKWGELDIVGLKKIETLTGKNGYSPVDSIHFFEVKTIYYVGTFNPVNSKNINMRPEEAVHGLKRHKLRRIMESYLIDRYGTTGKYFEFHVICVYIDKYHKKAKIKWLKNIIL